MSSEQICGKCAGAGRVDAYSPSQKKMITQTCPVCKGSGKIQKRTV